MKGVITPLDLTSYTVRDGKAVAEDELLVKCCSGESAGLRLR